eukprot:2186594-Amphidinium_carterae.1
MLPPPARTADDDDENWGAWKPQPQHTPMVKTRAPVPPEALRPDNEVKPHMDDTLSEYIRSDKQAWKEKDKQEWKEQEWKKNEGAQPSRGRKQRCGWQHKARARSGKPWQDWKRIQEGRKERTWRQQPQQSQQEDTPLQRARRRHENLQEALRKSGGKQRIKTMRKYMEERALPKAMPKRATQQAQWKPKGTPRTAGTEGERRSPSPQDPELRAALKKRRASKLQWRSHVKNLAKKEAPCDLLERLGVTCLDDLKQLSSSDLEIAGLSLVQRRVVLALAAEAYKERCVKHNPTARTTFGQGTHT